VSTVRGDVFHHLHKSKEQLHGTKENSAINVILCQCLWLNTICSNPSIHFIHKGRSLYIKPKVMALTKAKLKHVFETVYAFKAAHVISV